MPALLNVRVPPAAPAMLAGDPTVSNVTSWPVRPDQVTWPLSAMSTLAGENESPAVATLAAAGNGVVMVSAIASATDAPPAVASTLMVTAPAPTAVTIPTDETVARDGLDVDQLSEAAIAAPVWSFVAAVSCMDCPTASDVAGALMVTDVSTGTAAVTTIVRVAVREVLPAVAWALITAVPTATPATSPDCETAAMFDAVVPHAMTAAI